MKKWLILIIIPVIFLAIIFLYILFSNPGLLITGPGGRLDFNESGGVKNLKKYSVNLVNCYSSCPITKKQSLTNPEEMIDHINYSCKNQCDTEFKPITNGDIMDMNLARKESNELLEMLKEYHGCIQETVETEIHYCFSNFIEKYS